MNATLARMLPIVFLLAMLSAAPALAETIKVRWNSPSRLTPDQAAEVFLRASDGQSVSAPDLFEAEKYLRTDGPVSPAAPVVTDAFRRLLAIRLEGSPEIRVTALPPVLHWLESTFTFNSVRLKGETVQAAILRSDPNLAATVLQQRTILQEWKLCGVDPCFTPMTPQRSAITHELSVPLDTTTPAEARSSELILATGLAGATFSQTYPAGDRSRHLGGACETLPSQTIFTVDPATGSRMITRHSADRTDNGRINRVLCAFFALPGNPATLRYLRSGATARPSYAAARSAIVNNPLAFRIE